MSIAPDNGRNGRNGANGRNGRTRVFARWHRRVGLGAAILVLLLAVTGILLSHAEAFGLHRIHVTTPWIVRLYDVRPSVPPRASRAGEHWVVWIDGRVFLDGAATEARLDGLLGAVEGDGIIAVAGPDALLLLMPDGGIIDRIGTAALPARIARIGRDADGAIVLATSHGVFATRDGLDFAPVADDAEIVWAATLEDVPPAVLAPALAAWRGGGVPLHRIVADLHSGRFLGPVGPWLMDAAAIVLILLAGSGFILWRRRR